MVKDFGAQGCTRKPISIQVGPEDDGASAHAHAPEFCDRPIGAGSVILLLAGLHALMAT